jgi:6-phosphogluconolactonase
MGKPQIRVFNTLEDLSIAAAEHFTKVVRQAIASRGIAHVALSGGSTPQRLFQLLAQDPCREAVPWEAIHVYWGDERCVPPDDPESNYGQARRLLLDHVPVRQEAIHRMRGELPPEQAAVDFIQTLAQQAEAGRAWTRLDWVLLGMGADGHTASLFPGQVNPGEDTLPAMAVTADYQGRPANRVTLTPQVFNDARSVIFLVTGANKAAVLASVIKGPRDPLHLPAQRIQPVDGSMTWLVDAAAANSL